MFFIEATHPGAAHHTIFASLPDEICVVPDTLLLQCGATLIISTSYVRPQRSEGRRQRVWLVLQEARWSPEWM